MFPVPANNFKVQSKGSQGLPQTLSNDGNGRLHPKLPLMSNVQSHHTDFSFCDMTLTDEWALWGHSSCQHTGDWASVSQSLIRLKPPSQHHLHTYSTPDSEEVTSVRSYHGALPSYSSFQIRKQTQNEAAWCQEVAELMPTQAARGQSCALYPDTQLSLPAQVENPTQQHPEASPHCGKFQISYSTCSVCGRKP